LAIPNTSEKSVALDREENITKGNVSAKRVALYLYDSNDDTLNPITATFDNLLTELYVENGAMAKRVVQSGSVYYIGWAAPGTATNTNAWRISKVDTSGSPEIAVTTFADGNREFDNNWDDVLVLSYS